MMNVNFFKKILFHLLVFWLTWNGNALAFRPIEIILRQPPAEVPSAERLYLAQRLYELDRLQESRQWLESIMADMAPESPEALLLLGRIEFTWGNFDKCLARFNRLYAYYPESTPIVSGDLAHFTFRAMEILADEGQFGRCGGYIDLLKQIDPHAVTRMAGRLENQLDCELEAFQKDLGGLNAQLGDLLWNVSETDSGGSKIEAVGSCPLDDRGCAQAMDEKARRDLDRVKTREQADWDRRLTGYYEQAKASFARKGIEAGLAYPLIGRLVNDSIMQEAVEPKTVSGLTIPYEFSIVEQDSYRYRKGMDKYLKGAEIKMISWRILRRPRPEVLQDTAAITMSFGAPDRQKILENLGRLLYSKSGGGAAGKRKL